MAADAQPHGGRQPSWRGFAAFPDLAYFTTGGVSNGGTEAVTLVID